MPTTRIVALLALSTAVGCVALPLERENYFDGGGDTQLIVTGIPDTVASIGEEFTLSITSDPAPPDASVQFQTEIIAGAALLGFQGLTTYRATSAVGLLPVRAVLRVSVVGIVDGPVREIPVTLRQRPRSATLSCPPSGPCVPLAGVNAERTLRFALRDSLANLVNLPGGSFRYGAVVSRAPNVVEVLDRPTPNDIRVRARAVGAAWIVFSAEGGVADSLRLEVLP